MKNEWKNPQIFSINNTHTNGPETSDFIFFISQGAKRSQRLNKDRKKIKRKKNQEVLTDNLWREICWIYWKQIEPLCVTSQLWSAENEVHCHPPFLALERSFALLNDQCVSCFATYPIAWRNQQWPTSVCVANPSSHQRRLTQGNTVKDSRNFF